MAPVRRGETEDFALVDDRRSEDGKGRGGAKYNNGAQPVGRSPAGGREEGLDRPRQDEDDGLLSACDKVLSNEGPDLWGFGQSEGRSPIADSVPLVDEARSAILPEILSEGPSCPSPVGLR